MSRNNKEAKNGKESGGMKNVQSETGMPEGNKKYQGGAQNGTNRGGK